MEFFANNDINAVQVEFTSNFTKTHKPTYLVYDSTTSASYHFADEEDSKSNFTLLFFFWFQDGMVGGRGGGGEYGWGI